MVRWTMCNRVHVLSKMHEKSALPWWMGRRYGAEQSMGPRERRRAALLQQGSIGDYVSVDFTGGAQGRI